jgi:hypothetical protein
MSVPTDDKKSERERLSNLIVSHESQAESLLGFHKGQKKIVEGLKAQLAELSGERALTIASDSRCLYIHPFDSDARDSIVMIDKGSCTRLGIPPADLARHIVNKREIDHRLSIQELERKVVWLVRIIRQNFVDLKSAPSLVTSLFQALDHLDAAKWTEDKQPEKDLTPLKDAVIKAIRGYSDRSVETNWFDVAMALKNLDMAERQLAEANTGTEAPVTEASALTVAEEETDDHVKEKLNELDLVKDFLVRVYQFGVVIPTEDNLVYAARENYDCLRAIMRKTAKLLGAKDRQLPAALEQVKSDTKKTSGNITEKLSTFLRKRQKHVEATEPGVREARLQEQLMEMDAILREAFPSTLFSNSPTQTAVSAAEAYNEALLKVQRIHGQDLANLPYYFEVTLGQVPVGIRGCYSEDMARDFLDTVLNYSGRSMSEEMCNTFKMALISSDIREWVQKFNGVIPRFHISYRSHGTLLE